MPQRLEILAEYQQFFSKINNYLGVVLKIISLTVVLPAPLVRFTVTVRLLALQVKAYVLVAHVPLVAVKKSVPLCMYHILASDGNTSARDPAGTLKL